jgi:hypothetical protein
MRSDITRIYSPEGPGPLTKNMVRPHPVVKHRAEWLQFGSWADPLQRATQALSINLEPQPPAFPKAILPLPPDP